MRRLIQLKSVRSLDGKRLLSVTIIGGGPIGSSIALHLAEAGVSNVKVIERDLSYKSASSMLSAGGIRQQFGLPENILMTSYGSSFIKKAALECKENPDLPDPQFHENGYLYLGSDANILSQNHVIQQQCGASWIHLLTPEQLQIKFPWLNVNNIAIGSYGSLNEGYFDPWGLVAYMKKKAIEKGVQYIEGNVVDINIHLIEQSLPSSLVTQYAHKHSSIKSLFIQHRKNNTVEELNSDTFINAAGAWSDLTINQLLKAKLKRLNDSLNIVNIPVKPRKRSIFMFHCADSKLTSSHSLTPNSQVSFLPPHNAPLVIDISGVYFRPEGYGNKYIVGVSPSKENDIDYDGSLEALQYVDDNLFYDYIWPILYDRIPRFEQLKIITQWAGYYDYNTFDQNAIIDYHPNITNMILCTGFSGHGLMHSPAAGRAVTELIINHGDYSTIDLRNFSFERILVNKPYYEKNII